MLNQPLKDYVVSHILSRVQSPAQYLGGELNPEYMPLQQDRIAIESALKERNT